LIISCRDNKGNGVTGLCKLFSERDGTLVDLKLW